MMTSAVEGFLDGIWQTLSAVSGFVISLWIPGRCWSRLCTDCWLSEARLAY